MADTTALGHQQNEEARASSGPTLLKPRTGEHNVLLTCNPEVPGLPTCAVGWCFRLASSLWPGSAPMRFRAGEEPVLDTRLAGRGSAWEAAVLALGEAVLVGWRQPAGGAAWRCGWPRGAALLALILPRHGCRPHRAL